MFFITTIPCEPAQKGEIVDIKEVINLKKAMEKNIERAIMTEVKSFSTKTGCRVDEIIVDIEDFDGLSYGKLIHCIYISPTINV